MNNQPGLLIAGTHSGCGKTTVTLGIMAALAHRQVRVQPFKCGPDFIDPTLHQLVTGEISRNLDVRMCGVDFVRRTFARHAPANGCSVVEGVMGLFDGGEGSAATLATTLGLPVVLVVDVRSAAESVAAVVKGFATLDPRVPLAGVICNRVGSTRHQQMVGEAINRYCQVPVLGFLPRNEEVHIPSRHLGLHMGEEHPLAGPQLEHLISLVSAHLDLEQLLQLAGTHQAVTVPQPPVPTELFTGVRIGVARDQAFCFYYEDNLDMLRQAGAELVFFSPLHDSQLPAQLQGLYLGGGYPELHARRLSENHSLRRAIYDFSQSGRPVYAECGGFMYLCAHLTDLDGYSFPMVGVYPFHTRMRPKLRSLGYRQATMKAPHIFGPAGTILHGHEFHYSAIDELVEHTIPALYQLDTGKTEGYIYQQTLAGYVHLHWGRTPEAAHRFVRACHQSTPTD